MKNNYFFEAGGYEFESGVVDVVQAFASREWGAGAVKFSTTRQDRYEGTDLFVLGVPIDVTMDFERKNKTRRLGGLSVDGITIDFGVRFGNHRVNFNVPVLVIGAASAVGITKSNMWLVLDIIKENITEILNVGMDEYFVATEA
jgi:hypothetical protein